MLKGLIVEESLLDNRILNEFKVLNVEITTEDDPLERWHIYKVSAKENQLIKLSKQIKLKWYAHFYNGKSLIVVFRNKILKDKDSAIEYGLKQGIPLAQLDFVKTT